jgi:sphinganine-1-phosphate aldolase
MPRSHILALNADSAFYKTASVFNFKFHTVSCPALSYRVSIPKVRRLINPNTILLVALPRTIPTASSTRSPPSSALPSPIL